MRSSSLTSDGREEGYDLHLLCRVDEDMAGGLYFSSRVDREPEGFFSSNAQ